MVFDYQKEFDEPQVSDGPKVISKESVDFIVIQGILMITKSSMIQREFQLEVWTLTFQKCGHLYFVFVTNPRNSETKPVAQLCDASSELVLRYREGF